MSAAHLPPETLGQHIAIVGKTGSGKTYTAKGAVEGLLAQGRRVCIIDPTGVWWGLRLLADGTTPGFPVIVFGGDHGDVPVTDQSGERLGEIVAGRNFPCIVDLSEFTQGEKHRFMMDFAETLYAKNRQPLHLIIDEADEVAPQNPLPETKRMLHQIDRIVRRGRVRGFRVMLITQRPAVLHKNVLTQANTLVALRLQAPQDRKAIEEWVRGQADDEQWKEVARTLGGLQRGEGWVWAPEQSILKRTAFAAIKTFDSSRTPDDGEMITEPVALSPVDVAELREMLAPPVEEAEPEAITARDVEYIVDDEENNRLRGVVAELEEQLAQARSEAQEAHDRLGQIALLIGTPLPVAPPREPVHVELPPPPPSRPREAAPPKPNGHAHGKLAKAERSVLTALAQYPQGRTKTQVAILGAYAVTGGGFNNALSALRSQGYIEGGGDHLKITAAGLKALGPFQPLPRGRALLDHWLRQLDKAPRTILEAVAKSYPRPLTKEVIAAQTDYEAGGGGFNNALSRLRTLELITRGHDIKASDALFGR